MNIDDVMPLSFDDRFLKLGRVDYACFGPYFFELRFDRDYFIRFLSKTFVKKDGIKYRLPSIRGNYIFSCLASCYPQSYKEFDDHVEVTMDNGVTIICNTTLEPSCDNFHMKIPGISMMTMI